VGSTIQQGFRHYRLDDGGNGNGNANGVCNCVGFNLDPKCGGTNGTPDNIALPSL
jgi:hypothetical protein